MSLHCLLTCVACNSRLDSTEEKIITLEDKVIEIIQTETQKEKIKQKTNKKPQGINDLRNSIQQPLYWKWKSSIPPTLPSLVSFLC